MNAVIMNLTARQLLGKRRTLLMLLFALVPVVVAVIYAFGNDDQHADFTSDLLESLVITALLPIVALIFGTGALGSEIEDGTAVYLLGKPIPRWQIVISKLVVVIGISGAIAALAAVVAGAVAMQGIDEEGLVIGFTVGAIAGAVVYSCLFLFLSVLTGRALIAGLLYAFLWEGVVTNIFPGVRLLSVREYSLSIADAIADVSPSIFSSEIGVGSAIFGAVVVSVGTTLLAVIRLRAFEIGETA